MKTWTCSSLTVRDKTVYVLMIFSLISMVACAHSTDELFDTLLHNEDTNERKKAVERLAGNLVAGDVRRLSNLAGSNAYAREALTAMINYFEKTSRSGSSEKRKKAVQCLREVNSDESVSILGRILQNASEGADRRDQEADNEVKREAADSLGKITSNASIVALVRGLTPDQPDPVRSAIGDALINLGPAAVQPLITEKSKNSSLKGVEEILARIGEPAMQPLLVELSRSGEWVSDALARIGEPAVKPLMAEMGSDDRNTRFAAAAALVKMSSYNPHVIQPLISVLENQDLRGVAESYPFFIKLGRAGTEDILISALNRYGNGKMCVDYLNCGNTTLDEAARDWASRHGYQVYTAPGYHGGPKWGHGL